LQQSKEILEEQIEETSESSSKLGKKLDELRLNHDINSFQKVLTTNSIVVFQKLQKRYSDYSSGKYTFIQQDPDFRLSDLGKVKTRLTKISSMITKIQENSDGNLKPVLQTFSQFAEITSNDILAI
jgi:Zn-dependent M32 family carboxypeptidase